VDHPELSAALEELADAPARPYYDEAADTAARTAYYESLDPGSDGAALYTALNQLVTTTHGTTLPYRPAKFVYPWLDLHDDMQLRSVYSGAQMDPQRAIEEDFRNERARDQRVAELQASDALSADEVEHETELLEAAFPFNCEHVVCQSWFGKQEPMKGDVHHLFACEPGCNSFRGNTPYFDFPPTEPVDREDCGAREPTKFEPSNARGAVARATLYFLLRYPGKILPTALAREAFAGDLRELLAERIATLVTWHQAEEVSHHERHRNAAAFELQQNRNPLIDLPELAVKIDFTAALTI
jgi:endonuclease G, mitochondrial